MQRISFFVNAGVRFVEEMAKMRAFARAVGRDHRATGTASPTPRQRRFRYGVQVNSLGLTEAQPENNVQRIVLEMLGVTLSRDARARAVQLPAWNEALGLPRPWDQQWSLRMQQVLAYESDLLEYPDLFDGSHVVDGARRRPSWTVRGASWTRSWSWAAWWPPSSPATSRARSSPRWPSGGGASRPATTWWSASTGSPRPSRRR